MAEQYITTYFSLSESERPAVVSIEVDQDGVSAAEQICEKQFGYPYSSSYAAGRWWSNHVFGSVYFRYSKDATLFALLWVSK